MHLSIWLSLGILIWAIPSSARPGAKKKDQSLLWKVSSENLQRPSYILGTIHMVCPDDYLWTPAMDQALKESEKVCFELDLDDPELHRNIALGMVDASGKNLSEYFDDTTYQSLSLRLRDQYGIQMELLRNMKPVVLQTLLTSQVLDCEQPLSYESEILNLALAQEKEVLGLETAEEQVLLFDNLHVDSVIAQILRISRGMEEEKQHYARLIQLYRDQDLAGLHAMILEAGKSDLDLSGFLDFRNEKWIPRMEDHMDRSSVFFAVGAGHLWGEFGLIELLRKQGYLLEPIY